MCIPHLSTGLFLLVLTTVPSIMQSKLLNSPSKAGAITSVLCIYEVIAMVSPLAYMEFWSGSGGRVTIDILQACFLLFPSGCGEWDTTG